jgi:glycogen phosphorylase
VKQSLTSISPAFDCRRMLREYMTHLYEPAHTQHVRTIRDGFESVRERTRWNSQVREVWDRVKFVEPAPDVWGAISSGRPISVRAAIELAGLNAEDVRVEIVLGRIDSNGFLADTEVIVLPAAEQRGSVAIFQKDVVPERTGRLGYALRVSPNHFDDPVTRPCSNLLKWSQA